MAPADKILTPSEMDTARTMLQTKPPTISQEQFTIIKEQVLTGIPQAEYILVGFWIVLSSHFTYCVRFFTSLTRSLVGQSS